VPNLNWAAGSARPRYFQLRGIGELEQYQGAPNPSVGFLIDGIDYSGVGMPATTFDVEQVEVLRGPQGTAYGANALAGLISVRTRDATPTSELAGEATTGDTGTLAGGLVLGGALDAAGSAAYRLVAHHYESDGSRTNAFLDRDDTNGYDESTLRGRLKFTGEAVEIGVTAMYVDIDDGYDAFSIDNSRTTLSDDPGEDTQRSAAAAIDFAWRAAQAFDLRSLTTYGESRIGYGFDGDWGNDADWGIHAPYEYASQYERTRRALSQDLRLVSTRGGTGEAGVGWVAGAYLLDTHEDGTQVDTASDVAYRDLDSDFAATNFAMYGEVDAAMTARMSLSAGLRVERRDAEYRDVEAVSGSTSDFAPTDTMWGGHLSATYAETERRSWYATLSRGYKAGGFNIGSVVPEARREYAPETLWNLEAGVAWEAPDGRWSLRSAVFYMRREDQQVATSLQLDPGDPLSYVFLTDNAARGENYGLEGSFSWLATDRLEIATTFGLLETQFIDYATGDALRDTALNGRGQAHAPNYQYSVSAEYRDPRGLIARADVQGVDAFYFDTSHEQRSQPYTLVNLRVGYEAKRWAAYLWGRNLFDETYAMRGFYFGNEPPDFPDTLYVQLADGRRVGVTLTFTFD
jgi:outer membrane receptor protein involved in Fe transport